MAITITTGLQHHYGEYPTHNPRDPTTTAQLDLHRTKGDGKKDVPTTSSSGNRKRWLRRHGDARPYVSYWSWLPLRLLNEPFFLFVAVDGDFADVFQASDDVDDLLLDLLDARGADRPQVLYLFGQQRRSPFGHVVENLGL